MKPNYKLPSFRLGFIEVVTVAASAVTASFFKLKTISDCIVSGWTNALTTIFNFVFSLSNFIGRMIYETAQLKKLKTHPLSLSLLHNPILPHTLPQFCPDLSLLDLFSARLQPMFISKDWHKICFISKCDVCL